MTEKEMQAMHDFTEHTICTEQNYSPWKHFLFDLPDLLAFAIKFFAVIYGVKIVFGAIILSLMESLPSFCALIK